MNIRTTYNPPPISLRQFDWTAVDTDTYDGAEDSKQRQIGYGATEAEAIADLMEQHEDYVKHVHDGSAQSHGQRLAWCGAIIGPLDWAFQDADHAALNGRNKGRLLTCSACAAAICKALMQED